MNLVYEQDNFLSSDECDFLISYYREHKEKNHKSTEFYTDRHGISSNVMWIHKTNPFNLKKTLLFRKITKNISKRLSLKLNFFQVVYWPTNSYELGHYGGNDFNDNGTANQWACVCYLNDNYTGGDTILGTELKHITPKKGKMIIFEGQKIFHGISLVTSGDRFNLMSWWRSDQPKLTTETNGLTY
jgi:hypothetical protein